RLPPHVGVGRRHSRATLQLKASPMKTERYFLTFTLMMLIGTTIGCHREPVIPTETSSTETATRNETATSTASQAQTGGDATSDVETDPRFSSSPPSVGSSAPAAS